MNDLYWMAAVLLLSLALTGMGLWKVFCTQCRPGNPWMWMLALFILQTIALTCKGASWGECPIRGISEVVFFMGWALNAFYLLLGRLYRMSILGLFTAPAVAGCTIISLLTYSRAMPLLTHSEWLPWHIGLAMLSYGAFGLAAVAGIVFLIQDSFLKEHRVTGISGKLPPVRTLHSSMKRLLLIGFILLVASELFGYLSGLDITAGKSLVAMGVSMTYLVLLLFVYLRGLPGRTLAWCSLTLYVCSLAIFFVLK